VGGELRQGKIGSTGVESVYIEDANRSASAKSRDGAWQWTGFPLTMGIRDAVLSLPGAHEVKRPALPLPGAHEVIQSVLSLPGAHGKGVGVHRMIDRGKAGVAASRRFRW